MDRETQVEVVNICIVNALRIDEEHRMMILEKLTQNLTNENRSKLLRLLNVVGRSEQFKCSCGENCWEYNKLHDSRRCMRCGLVQTNI